MGMTAQSPGYHVAVLVAKCFFSGEQSPSDHFVDHRVVLRHLKDLTVADEIKTTIADPSRPGPGGFQGQDNASGSHPFQTFFALSSAVDLPSGRLECIPESSWWIFSAPRGGIG